MKIKMLLITVFLLFIIVLLISLRSPSLDRDWLPSEKILADISYSGSIVEIKKLRDFDYRAVDDFDIRYYDSSYNLDKLETLYYIVEPFGGFDGPAHTMLSFGFSDGQYLVASAEVRKEKGEKFNPFLGLINSYEMVYILGSERDLIRLRANYRQDDVYMYPIKADKQKIKELFISVLDRAYSLSKEPKFYNTLYNSCATSILDHVNIVRTDNGINKIGWSTKVFLPANSDKIAYDYGLIDTDLSFEEAKKYYQINDLSEMYEQGDNYSQIIRKERK